MRGEKRDSLQGSAVMGKVQDGGTRPLQHSLMLFCPPVLFRALVRVIAQQEGKVVILGDRPLLNRGHDSIRSFSLRKLSGFANHCVKALPAELLLMSIRGFQQPVCVEQETVAGHNGMNNSGTRKRGIDSMERAGSTKAIALGVCEYLARILDCQSSTTIPLERAIIPVLEAIYLEVAAPHKLARGVDAATFAAMIAWAIYGAAYQWAQLANRKPAEQMAAAMELLVNPVIQTSITVR
jgi:hypothetical protein